MVLIHEAVKQGHAETMERRLSLVKPLLRRRLITNVECEVVSVVSDAFTLETTTLLFVVNVELVSMLTLEPNCLLVCR